MDSIRDKRRAIWLGTLGLAAAALLLGLSPGRSSRLFRATLQGFASSLLGPGILHHARRGRAYPSFSERIGRNARLASIGNGLTAAVMGIRRVPTSIRLRSLHISAALVRAGAVRPVADGRSRGSIAMPTRWERGGQGQDNPS